MIASVVFATLNVLASFVIAAIVAWKLSVDADRYTPIERIGMGLTAAGAILSIGPVTSSHTPFDDWSGILMRIGIATYFVGRITRHRYNNWLARRQAHNHFLGR